MAKYIITINTRAYSPMKASKHNWERGTINDFMYALNNYRVVERSLKGVRRRVNVFIGRGAYYSTNVNEYYNWLNDPKNKARITFYDNICGMTRTEDVSPYGIKQGYVDPEEIMQALCITGSVIIPFDSLYDSRQAGAKLYKGCYMQIVKA